jgi:hypothetical protein
MQHLEGSGTPVLYIGRMVLKVKTLLPGFTNQYLSKKKKHLNLQFSDPDLANLGACTDYPTKRGENALFYTMPHFRKLVQSALHEFFRKTQQQQGDRAIHRSIDLTAFVKACKQDAHRLYPTFAHVFHFHMF